ncbi:hypothetical protein [Pseudomonas syringae]|uniref:hypothetical protein n=1 Tax=Pseudomonas syringae TaxID=317 RepID=UPI002364AF03|nr:hypothetical protein [Pseudomonas syringae]MBL3832454.1 hypothetical protein [Pseudomonas syringae pv. theae]MBL3868264.1 hypothetical protein [Pseudomonas syringae pv. theae]GKQ49101.1 hypothetical protein PSTH2693_28115 [Pseudomonas syringae pv. theae]
MNAESAVELVCARLVEENSIPVKIRTRNIVSDEEVGELLQAVDFLISYYKERDDIPKKLALAFVDIYVGFNVVAEFYSGIEIQRFEDIGITLQEKAYELFE